ncbi:class F sortase [Kribbella antiqua]|uniref:class F sortase n=1 Tax=Kribbella antiqua TaxID=2512217 RepID=UPI001F53F31D|nr:class F sortase [Kribbella antiqua]
MDSDVPRAVPSAGTDGGTPSSVPVRGAPPGFEPAIVPTVTPTPESAGTASVPPAQIGTPAPTQRIRFVPTQVVLPGGAKAPVLPATTVDGQLQVPEGTRRVGWWDGGAEAGDPYGSVVLAGHVDTKAEGIAYFARLLRITPGEVVVLRGSGHTATYRVTSIVSVPKDALATRSGAFDQTTDHRLVLITCTGAYDASKGGYEENLVVTAAAIGLAK